MLDLCKSKGVFNNYVCASVEPEKKIPHVDDGMFFVLFGAACPNTPINIVCEVVAELLKSWSYTSNKIHYFKAYGHVHNW